MGSPVVLLTGASAGLGLAIARSLIARDYRLILTAREASLTRFAEFGIRESERLWLRPLDVTQDAQRKEVVREANATWGGVDVLLNNAGISLRSVAEHVTEADRTLQMTVNYAAPMELTRLVLPRMRKKRQGRILNISSVGGMMAMPTMSVYSASKFALEGASEALWYEVKPFGIHVSLIEPGFINSDGFEKVQFSDLGQTAHDTISSAYHWHYHYMEGFIARVARRVLATPDSVARTVVRTLEQKRPPLRVPATFDARMFTFLRRVLPRGFYHWILYRSLPNVREWGPMLR
ncbi:MAG: SDR family NAD(P)-dependent oxidoreductase [Polyangiaceae bacterium]